MTEAELQNKIIGLCKRAGLIWHHSTDSTREKSGWPDLVIVGPGGILFRELKSDDGRITIPQRKTGSMIERAGGNWGIWRPQQLADGTIARWLNLLARDPAVIPSQPAH